MRFAPNKLHVQRNIANRRLLTSPTKKNENFNRIRAGSMRSRIRRCCSIYPTRFVGRQQWSTVVTCRIVFELAWSRTGRDRFVSRSTRFAWIDQLVNCSHFNRHNENDNRTRRDNDKSAAARDVTNRLFTFFQNGGGNFRRDVFRYQRPACTEGAEGQRS